MHVLMTVSCIVLLGALLVFLTAYGCYRFVFYSPPRRLSDEIEIPRGDIYLPHKDEMAAWIVKKRQMPQEDVEFTSFDGLTLRGKYFEYAPGAPLEILFHGYRGNAERDMCGGIERCFAIGHNVLLCDQRGSGASDGHVITFGVRESRDCLCWAAFAIEKFGPDVQIILGGISMGAATVLTAAGEKLPPQVRAVLADCGYTSPRAIICKVMGDLHLPPKLLYPLVRLGARVYGGFDLDAYSPIRAMQRCRVSVIFFHGDDDRFVPMDMSRENHAACAAPSRLVIISGAGHGLCYICDKPAYLAALRDFCREHGIQVQ